MCSILSKLDNHRGFGVFSYVYWSWLYSSCPLLSYCHHYQIRHSKFNNILQFITPNTSTTLLCFLVKCLQTYRTKTGGRTTSKFPDCHNLSIIFFHNPIYKSLGFGVTGCEWNDIVWQNALDILIRHLIPHSTNRFEENLGDKEKSMRDPTLSRSFCFKTRVFKRMAHDRKQDRSPFVRE